MSVDEHAQAEANVARASVVVVGRPSAPGDPDWLARVSSAEVSALVASRAPAVQPGQLWLFHGLAGAPGMRDRLDALGALGIEVADDEQAWRAIALHLAAEVAFQRTAQAALRQENTALRRELNRALSALDQRHPILGLLPSATIDDLAANRTPRLPPAPPGAPTLMHSVVDLNDAHGEVHRLREEIAAIHQTKVMRWSRLPRRLYGRIRRR